jgi:hypothetical protein
VEGLDRENAQLKKDLKSAKREADSKNLQNDKKKHELNEWKITVATRDHENDQLKAQVKTLHKCFEKFNIKDCPGGG